MASLKRILVLLAAPVLLLTACSEGNQAVSDDPDAALEQALENLAGWQGARVVLSLEGSTDSIIALSDGELTEDSAQKVFDSSLEVTSKEGEDVADQQFQMRVNVAGQDGAIELMGFGQSTIYVRADVDGLFDTFGGDRASLEVIKQQYGSQPGFEFINELLSGEWVAFTGADQFVERMTGQPVDQQTEEQQAMAEELANALRDNADAEAGDKEGPGGHVIVTLPVRDFYEDFKQISEAAGSLATGGAPLPDPSEVPDEEVVLDAWIDDEQLTQIELDITQFADWKDADMPEGVDDFRVRVTLEEFTGSLDEPDAAAEVDFSELMQLFLGGIQGGSAGGGATGGGTAGGNEDVCAEIEASLEGQPDEVIEQAKQEFKALCPNLGE